MLVFAIINNYRQNKQSNAKKLAHKTSKVFNACTYTRPTTTNTHTHTYISQYHIYHKCLLWPKHACRRNDSWATHNPVTLQQHSWVFNTKQIFITEEWVQICGEIGKRLLLCFVKCTYSQVTTCTHAHIWSCAITLCHQRTWPDPLVGKPERCLGCKQCVRTPQQHERIT